MSQEDTPMEKMSFGTNDFSESLSSHPNFGIEDSQLVNADALNSFLLQDPDKVEKAADQKQEIQDTKKEKAAEPGQEDGQQAPKKVTDKNTEPKDDPRKLLEDVLYSEGNEPIEGGDDPKSKKSGGDNTDNGDEGIEEENTYNTLSKDLLKLGVFTGAEGETEDNIAVKTPEEFLERFNTEKKKGAINILDNFLSQYGEEYRKMFDAVFVNGVSPKEYLNTFSKIEDISNVDLSDESNQISILRTYYKSLNWDDAKIDNRIKKIKDYGELEEESKAFHEVLVNQQKEAIAKLENKKKEDNRLQQEKELATSKSYERILNEKLKSQEIDGIPLTQKDASDIYSYLVNKSFKLSGTGELISEFEKDLMELNRPENHEMKVKLALLLKRKLDVSSIKKNAVTKRSEALFTLATKNAKHSKPQPKSFFS